MPENYFGSPLTGDNNSPQQVPSNTFSSGATGGFPPPPPSSPFSSSPLSSNPAPSSLSENNLNSQSSSKFAPPPSNIFIRTSDSDLEKMKESGGNIPQWAPNQSVFTPTSPLEGSSPLQAPSNPNLQEPIINPQIAPDLTNLTKPPAPPSSNKLLPFIIILGIVILGAGLGYFVLWPKFFGSSKVSSAPTTTISAPVVITPSTTVTTLKSSPYPQISGPYQKTPVEISLSGSVVLEAIKNAALQTKQPAQTFSVLMPKYRDYVLSGEEIINSLLPVFPENLKPFLYGRKYLLYTYYGQVNPSLGLVIDIGQDNVPDVQAAFSNWEKGKILSNLSNFWLIKIPRPAARAFKDATTTGASIRYFPYLGKEAAISYGFFNNYLIISSSLESVNSAVSHLQGNTELIYP